MNTSIHAGRFSGVRWIYQSALLPLSHVAVAPAAHAEDLQLLLPGILTRAPTDTCVVLFSRYAPWTYYLLDDIGSFSIGDTVVVTAPAEVGCACGEYMYPCLPGNTIAPLRDYDFGCGTITIESEDGCVTFFSARFGSFAVNGSSGFQAGDTLRGVGTIQLDPPAMIPECVASFRILEGRLTACSDSLYPVRKTSWGQLKRRFEGSSR